METSVIFYSVVIYMHCVFGKEDHQNSRFHNDTKFSLIGNNCGLITIIGTIESLIQSNLTCFKNCLLNSFLAVSLFWLKDLLDSYHISFPRQVNSTFKCEKKSIPPNLNKLRKEAGICLNVTFFNVGQTKRLISKFGQNKTLNDKIDGMLDNPRARLFRFNNFKGAFEDFHYRKSIRNGMCTNLQEWSTGVGSVFTFGKCVRLFERELCRGYSLAIYPGSPHSDKLSDPQPITFQSIGPCFSNEFSGSSFDQTNSQFVKKNRQLKSFVPDLVSSLYPEISLRLKGFKAFKDIAYQLELGPRNRTRRIFMNPRKIVLKNITQKTGLNDWNFEKTLEKEDEDILGFVLPPKFGGPITEAFNVFPAHTELVVEWERILSNILEEGKMAQIFLTFEYENTNKSRPICFYFYAGVNDRKPFYGRILNGYSNAERDIQFPAKSKGHVKSAGSVEVNLTLIYQLYTNISTKSEQQQSIKSSEISIHNFNQRNSVPSKYFLSCQRRNSSEIQVQGNYNESNLNATIQEMIGRPMVRIYSGENLTGDFEDYYFGNVDEDDFRGCYNTKKIKKAKSAMTFNKCIRLFEYKKCEGISLAIYLGSEYSDRIADSGLTQVRSVGPCLVEEFENASIRVEFNGRVFKNPGLNSYFPDLLLHQFSSKNRDGLRYFYRNQFANIKPMPSNLTILKGSGLKVVFGLGTNDRVEHIIANAYLFGLVEVQEIGKVEESFNKNERDVPCYLFPSFIGGQANESWNTFLARQSKCEDWTRILPTSFSDSNQFINFGVSLNFEYETDLSSKHRYVYYLFTDRSTLRIYYGRFINN